MMKAMYTISDSNSADSGLDYGDAVERINKWYRDSDQWSDGVGDDDEHGRIAEAIDGVAYPSVDGGVDDLQRYADDICEAVAMATGNKSWAGHGTYYVSAADQAGYSLSVECEPRYDYRTISADGRQWINDLRRDEDGFPAIDDLCSMTADERDALAAYLRYESASLTVEDNEFSAGVGDEIEAL